MKRTALLFALIVYVYTSSGQSYTYRTFNDTRIINGHSIETLAKGAMDIRISHRFGDLLGDLGGASTMFGLDDVADVRLAVEYGVTNNISLGIGRSKGAGPYRQLLDGFVKYKILAQKTDNSMPFSLVLLGTSSYALQQASADLTSPSSYRETIHRFAYCTSLIIGRKFGDRFSLQVSPSYVHRNYVAFDDQNGIFSAGVATRLKVSKMIGIIAEYHYLFPYNRATNFGTYFNPIGLGVEFDTGGHIFQLNYTNSRGMGETQFIPYTTSDILEGQFRLGFTISRVFKLRRPKESKE
jgi:hypothetical protein